MIKDLEKLTDDELIREYAKNGLAFNKLISIDPAILPAISEVADDLQSKGTAIREAIERRMANSSQSHEWNGVGPKRDCPLRVVWDHSKDAEWIHFTWKDNDASGYNDGEGEYSVTHEGYYNDASTISITESGDGWMGHSGKFDDINGADFTITHYAELPEIETDEQPPPKERPRSRH